MSRLKASIGPIERRCRGRFKESKTFPEAEASNLTMHFTTGRQMTPHMMAALVRPQIEIVTSVAVIDSTM